MLNMISSSGISVYEDEGRVYDFKNLQPERVQNPFKHLRCSFLGKKEITAK